MSAAQYSPKSQIKIPWHADPIREIIQTLTSSENGLSQGEALIRLEEYGPNRLPEIRPPSLLIVFIRQFRSPLIYILAAAAIVSLFIGELTDAGFIAGVLLINAAIGSYQEWRAEKSGYALRKLLRIEACVQRDGEVRQLPAEDLVPGDVVWLESGNRVPADVRLITAHGLEIDESLLTGESLPTLKDHSFAGVESAVLSERQNMAHAGTIVTRGRAKGIVVATATFTCVGQLALDVLERTGGESPLLIRMKRFTAVVAVSVLAAAVAIGALSVLGGSLSIADAFVFAVALAVSAIPEGLPVAMTVALAVAITRMARRGVIVRQLAAVEGLGSCTYIGSDKTGTLTCNELTVKEVLLFDGQVLNITGEGFAPVGQVLKDDIPIVSCETIGLERLARVAVLCNEAELHIRDGEWSWRGDTVDIALLSLGHKLGCNRKNSFSTYPQVNQIPFEPEHQYAATYHATADGTLILVKGGPERVLSMCNHSADGTSIDSAESMAANLAARGFRVLALADTTIDQSISPSDTPSEPDNLAFLGYVGMIDPLRAGVVEAIHTCHNAGIQISMITGDHPLTALSIARELQLAREDSEVVTGKDLMEASEDELVRIVRRAGIFARVTPHQKLEIVQAAQRAGHFVAVTGDGVNDAPALRAANIGVAMGKSGTDVAREASDLVLSDDNFGSIIEGIEEGRVAYDNIRKVIYLLISTGAAEVILMGLAVLFRSPLPLLPVQILWLNLVTNGIQDVALAFEPGETGVLARKPRPPRERIFNRLMIERTLVAAFTMGLIGFATFHWLVPANPSDQELASARNLLLFLFVLFENFHIGNCRSETRSIFTLSPLGSPILLTGTLTAFSVHVLFMYLPFGQTLLGASPLQLREVIIVLGLAFLIVPVMEIQKIIWRVRSAQHQA